MGYSLNLSLFRDVDASDVYTALINHCSRSGLELLPPKNPREQFVLHRTIDRWCVLKVPIGWDWNSQRNLQRDVGKLLWARSLILFSYDGDYWGYELFNADKSVDCFLQSSEETERWFPGHRAVGNPEIFSAELEVSNTDAAAYIQQKPSGIPWEQLQRANTPVRAGDKFARYDECAVLDFTNFLKIPGYRHIAEDAKSSIWKTFIPQ